MKKSISMLLVMLLLLTAALSAGGTVSAAGTTDLGTLLRSVKWSIFRGDEAAAVTDEYVVCSSDQSGGAVAGYPATETAGILGDGTIRMNLRVTQNIGWTALMFRITDGDTRDCAEFFSADCSKYALFIDGNGQTTVSAWKMGGSLTHLTTPVSGLFADHKDHLVEITTETVNGSSLRITVSVDGKQQFDVVDQGGSMQGGPAITEPGRVGLHVYQTNGSDGSMVSLSGAGDTAPTVTRPTKPFEGTMTGDFKDILRLEWLMQGESENASLTDGTLHLTGKTAGGVMAYYNYAGDYSLFGEGTLRFRLKINRNPGWTVLLFRVSGSKGDSGSVAFYDAALSKYALMFDGDGAMHLAAWKEGNSQQTDMSPAIPLLFDDGEAHLVEIETENVSDSAVRIVVYVDGVSYIDFTDDGDEELCGGPAITAPGRVAIHSYLMENTPLGPDLEFMAGGPEVPHVTTTAPTTQTTQSTQTTQKTTSTTKTGGTTVASGSTTAAEVPSDGGNGWVVPVVIVAAVLVLGGGAAAWYFLYYRKKKGAGK